MKQNKYTVGESDINLSTRASPEPDTYHAPAERLSPEELAPTSEALAKNSLVQSMLEAFPEMAVVLNPHRQIVACNHALLTTLGTTDPAEIIGRRLGEVLGCVHSTEMVGGCGTSETCRTCGALNAMLRCRQEREVSREECRISTPDSGAWELDVVATPLDVSGQQFTIFAARDISALKRRAALERLFFHDTLNVAGGIQGFAELLASDDNMDKESASKHIEAMASQLIEQICGQRDLTAAERGELRPVRQSFRVVELFEQLKRIYEYHPVAKDRTLVCVLPDDGDLGLKSDPVLLQRVLGNLIKNALEASKPGEEVAVSCEPAGHDRLRFAVHNNAFMSREIQLQVFQRSFSTKARTGRGLGTFSVKLLTTRYLGGTVDFTSEPYEGTTFFVTLPDREKPASSDSVPNEPTIERQVGLQGVRVLLAEDSATNQRLLSFYLDKTGAELTVAETGEQAFRRAVRARDEGTPFDVILMDMQMPVMNGFEATRRLRQEGYDGLILALTAQVAEEDVECCLAAGCDGHLPKPIDRDRFLSEISVRLAERRGALQTVS